MIDYKATDDGLNKPNDRSKAKDELLSKLKDRL